MSRIAIRRRLSFEALETRNLLSGSTFTVTRTDDGTSTDTGTLRWAISQANQFTDDDEIVFASSLNGQAISLNSALPTIIGPVSIGSNSVGAPFVTLEPGSGFGGTGQGLIFGNGSSGSNLLQVTVAGFPGGGVLVTGNGSLQVRFCEIALNGVSTSNNAYGIEFNTINDEINNVESCIVSSNYGHGIVVSGTPSVEIQNNYIGTNVDGTVDFGNTLDGIHVDSAAGENIHNNLISGNDGDGIRILHVVSGGTVHIEDNAIGTNASETSAVANTGNGIDISSSSTTSQTVDFAIDDNVVSGNHGDGIVMTNLVTDANFSLLGNFVGTDNTGNAALGNFGNGIEIVNTVSTNPTITIGDPLGNSSNINVISSNVENGIRLSGAHIDGIIAEFNNIGIGKNGAAALGNGDNGVLITNGASANYVAQNIIANNTNRGIFIDSTGGTDNKFSKNSIFSNGGLGIDIGAIGQDTNDIGDADAGPNDLQNSPIIRYAEQNSITGSTHVEVEIDSIPSQQFILELYSSNSPDASGYGEGTTFLDREIITTDGTGFALLRENLSVAVGKYITATATENLTTFTGSTSEFSNALVVSAATPPVITGVTIARNSGGTIQDSYGVLTGSGVQLQTVPVASANEILVQFSEDVNVSSGDLSLVSWYAHSTYTLASGGFGYDSSTHTAHWIFASPFVADQIEIDLPETIIDLAGNKLDGDWTNPTTVTQTSSQSGNSGNGTAGGSFAFYFTILPGDANQDNSVNLGDISVVTNPSNWQHVGGWNDGNVNTDTIVDLGDINVITSSANWQVNLLTFPV
ncbi:MAG TPA: right-handed parallel beta-helix repeat-containing protein [Pirellulales bacterium]|jgi:hypothetical protein|nr:right-handed parallel beta-helix repeat-containing protein [Pirellulales bacterium]